MRALSLLVLFAASVVVLLLCRENQPSDNKVPPHVTTDSSANYDSLMNRILLLQDAVRAGPTDVAACSELLRNAFDSASGSFLAVGKGTVKPDYPAASVESARKTAARYDARRWSLYLKAWHTGEKKPFGSQINGDIMYSRVLRERMVGDTLQALLMVPMGSAVVK